MKKYRILICGIFALFFMLPFKINAAEFDTFYYILDKPEVGVKPADKVTEIYKNDETTVSEEFSIKWLQYDTNTNNYIAMNTDTFVDKMFYKFELVDSSLEEDWKNLLINDGHTFTTQMKNITDYRLDNIILTGEVEFALGGIDFLDISLEVPVAGVKPNNKATIAGPIGSIKNKDIEIKWYEYIDEDTNIPMSTDCFEEGKKYDFEIVTPINEYVADAFFIGNRVLIDDRTSIYSDSHIYAGYFGPLEKLFKINYDFENILLIEPQEYIRPNSPFLLFVRPNFGYELPDDISVSIDGEKLSKDKYIYDIENNILNIDGQYITGNLDIKIDTVAIEVNVINKTKNLISSNTASKIKIVDGYETTFSVNDGYKLPNYVEVLIDDSYLANDVYTYDKETGKLTILNNVITGDITIKGSSIKIVENSEETKKFDSLQYKLEQTAMKNYLCDELKNTEYFIDSYINQNKLVFVTPDANYLVDILQKGICKKITDEEYDELMPDEPWYEYYFDYDNTIKKVNSMAAYLLTTDISVIPNKTYYVYAEDDKWIVVNNPTANELATYYERVYITYDDEFNEKHEYYSVDFVGRLSKVDDPKKEEFDDYNYFIKNDEAKEETLLIIDKDVKFILSNENNDDYEFNKNDLNNVQVLGDKTYLVFDDGHSGNLYLYNLDGTRVNLPFEYKYIDYIYSVSKNNLYTISIIDASGNFVNYLVDENFNIIFKQVAENYEYEIVYLKSIDNTDYFSLLSPEHENIMLKVTKETNSGIQPPLTYDGIHKSIFIAIISLTLLIICIMLKFNKSIN